MTRQKRDRKRKKKARCSCVALFFSMIFVLFYVEGTLAAQKMVIKEPKDKQAPSSSQKTQNILAKPGTKLVKGRVYDPTGKTDPFRPFIAVREAPEKKMQGKPKTYLETLDLSQLDLTAIILSPKGNWAMVRDAKGAGYVITKGTLIGTNGGVVHQIREKEVIIHEKCGVFMDRNSLVF